MHNPTESPTNVVYLIGAGASHACVKRVNSPHGILMENLNDSLANKVRTLIETRYRSHRGLSSLVNTVIDENTDFEQIITFLADSPSLVHRQFAEDLRKTFEEVLRGRLDAIRRDFGSDPVELYATLLDMHRIVGSAETLGGILTTNYDLYLEAAMSQVRHSRADLGFQLQNRCVSDGSLTLIKLHGSFDWQETWPTSFGAGDATLWIPPGIQKAKQTYPFNILWGLARELLACDVLRIIGCRLGGNDWDLISLLFTTRHVNSNPNPYRIEVIDSPKRAEDIKAHFPFLDVLSILEIEDIGDQLVSDFTVGRMQRYDELSKDKQQAVIKEAGEQRNWFELWLRHKVEALFIELGSVETPTGHVNRFLEVQ